MSEQICAGAVTRDRLRYSQKCIAAQCYYNIRNSIHIRRACNARASFNLFMLRRAAAG